MSEVEWGMIDLLKHFFISSELELENAVNQPNENLEEWRCAGLLAMRSPMLIVF